MSRSASLETAIAAILADHFDDALNPHETIYRIWLMLNANSVAETAALAAFDSDGMSRGKYH